MRRVIFILVVLVFRKTLWLQLASQTAISTAMVIYLLQYWPYEERSRTKIETFNECTLVILTYFLFCFSDFLPEAETRNGLGFYYNGLILLNVGFHLYIMLRTKYGEIRLCCLKRRYAKRMSKLAAATRQNTTNEQQQTAKMINVKPKS